MGQTSKAQSTYEKALELDPQCSEALEGYRNCSIATHSDPEEVKDLFCCRLYLIETKHFH